MQAFGFTGKLREDKEAFSKARCEFLTVGNLDTHYDHQCSFQILMLSTRIDQKVDSEKLRASTLLVISPFDAFPRDMLTLFSTSLLTLFPTSC